MEDRHPDDPVVSPNSVFSVYVTETVVRRVYVHTHDGHEGAENLGLAYVREYPDADNIVTSVSQVSTSSFSQCEHGASERDDVLYYGDLRVVLDA